jgi:hypothetical protein
LVSGNFPTAMKVKTIIFFISVLITTPEVVLGQWVSTSTAICDSIYPNTKYEVELVKFKPKTESNPKNNAVFTLYKRTEKKELLYFKIRFIM